MSQVSPEQQAQENSDHDIERNNGDLNHLLHDNDFESMSAKEILAWASYNFEPDRTVLSTSFQYSGITMIHMVRQLEIDLRIATVDTLRLHEDTYAYIRELEQCYGIKIEVHRPNPAQVQSMVERFGEYLFFDSKAKQEYCCQVRKLRPHNELLQTADCWISGVRRDQSTLREPTPKATTVVEYGTPRQILKLNPMADWTEKQLRQFVEENQVPTHPLYAKGYRSIGCVICSTPTLAGEDQRAGRWRWFNGGEKISEEEIKECGLHVPMYNI